MTGEEVRKMKNEELQAELGRLRTRLFDLRSQTVTEKVENTAQFALLRRDVARLLTERNARARGPAAASKPEAAPSGRKKPAARPAAKKAAGGEKSGSKARGSKRKSETAG